MRRRWGPEGMLEKRSDAAAGQLKLNIFAETQADVLLQSHAAHLISTQVSAGEII